MRTSKEGIDLIKEFESLELSAYPDPATGGEPWTIGYGHTSMAGPPKVFKGLRVTATEAEYILQRDLTKYEGGVERLVKVPLTQNQFDALVSFAFNCGVDALKKSTLLKRVNAKAFDALDKATQAALLKAGAAAGERGWKISDQKDDEYLKELAAKGMTVDRSSAKLKSELKAIGERMTAEWLKQAGADGQAIIDAYNK